MTDPQLVSVVVPAYNVAATIDETLRSVRAQTHRALEIIVVDDGSTDDTRAIAERHAALDDRVQVITQGNAGLAAARNTGWRRAQSDLIAFVDADDLWAPTKIERQVRALKEGGPRVGLVYCWHARIDDQGKIINAAEGPRWEGDVLDRILFGNFVGNGSAALVRRQALTDANGFESKLRAAGAEGCEDFLFYCRVAERYHYAVVTEHLVGYRYLYYNMSSNRPRMLRSWMMVVDELMASSPDRKGVLTRGLRQYSGWLAHDALSNDTYRQVPRLLLLLLTHGHPVIAIQVASNDVFRMLVGKLRGRLGRRGDGSKTMVGATGLRFPVGDVDA